MMEIEEYRKVQNVAKQVHEQLCGLIDSESTEKSISEAASELLCAHGISDTWYHGIAAFVLLGSRSCLSISGRDYQPSLEEVGETNLITVDLSPLLGGIWGDCARSFFVENGKCTKSPTRKEFQQGKAIENELHNQMKAFVTPDTLFSELYEYGNQKIREYGYENLDFLGNLGHSIEVALSKRRFIDESCNEALGNVNLFTFEPHIRKIGASWGFKHENIYYFDETGRAIEL